MSPGPSAGPGVQAGWQACCCCSRGLGLKLPRQVRISTGQRPRGRATPAEAVPRWHRGGQAEGEVPNSRHGFPACSPPERTAAPRELVEQEFAARKHVI